MSIGDTLWVDLKTDEERIEFLASGRAVATGILAPCLESELVDVYRKLIAQKAALEQAERDLRAIPLHNDRASSNAMSEAEVDGFALAAADRIRKALEKP